MKTAWTRMLALGIFSCSLACVVTVDDGDDDDIGGRGGSAARGGSSTSGGSSANGGTSTSGGSGGESGGSGDGDSGVVFPAPTCEPEDGDELDECIQCFKRNCCSEWLECDDQSCTLEWIGVAECLEEQELPGEDELGMCISEASETGDGFVQANTQGLIDCALSPTEDGIDTLCSSECFGSDIYYE